MIKLLPFKTARLILSNARPPNEYVFNSFERGAFFAQQFNLWNGITTFFVRTDNFRKYLNRSYSNGSSSVVSLPVFRRLYQGYGSWRRS